MTNLSSYVLVWLGLLATLFSRSTLAECRFQTFAENEVSVETMGARLLEWKKTDPSASSDDLICCLPESWRKNYIVLPNSQSAQCSGAKFPRVILPDPGHAELEQAISFVGEIETADPDHRCRTYNFGDNNPKAAEFMKFDKNLDPDLMFQFHEVSKTGAHKNLATCIECHTTSVGVGPYYPDTGVMASHLGGLAKATSGIYEKLLCIGPEEKNQQKEWSDAFQEIAGSSSKGKRPYNCLVDVAKKVGKKGQGEGMAKANARFGERLALSQAHWLAANIKKIPNYQNLKFALVGAALGCGVEPAIRPRRASEPGRDSQKRFARFFPSNLYAPAPDDGEIVRHHCTLLDGNCGKLLPKTCTQGSSMLQGAMADARAESPPMYGQILAKTFSEQGRAAFFNPTGVQKMAQLTFVLGLARDKDHAKGHRYIAHEFFGPNLSNFTHLAKLLAEGDEDLSEVRQAVKAKSSLRSACAKLQRKSAAAIAKINLPTSEAAGIKNKNGTGAVR